VPTFWEFLTRDELRLCFVIGFLENAQGFGGAYPTEKYASPGAEGRTSYWIELFRRAIRYLALDCGFTFTGLQVQRDGSILAKPVEPRNRVYQVLFDAGDIPDLEGALRDSIVFAEREITGFHVEPLREALAKVEADIKALPKGIDREKMAGIRKLRRDAVREFMNDRVKEV
jgi:hypothetical protein